MSVVVPLFLLAPLVLVPLGLRLFVGVHVASAPWTRLMIAALPAAALLVVAFALPPGPAAAVLSLPWMAVTAALALSAVVRLLRDADRFRPAPRHALDAALAFLAVGAVFVTTDRFGVRPFDFSTTIILLTAVHFHFAGFVLPLAGALAYRRRPSRWLGLAIGLVVVGIPTTAVGFFGIPSVNWVGSMLVALGGFGIGIATVMAGGPMTSRAASVFGWIAGLSLLISMPLAAIYATGLLTGAGWLDVPTMARVHGGLNAIGFALPVLVAWTLQRRAARDDATPADPLDVMGFNWPAFVLGPVAVGAGIVAGRWIPAPVGMLILLGAAVGAVIATSAIVAVAWVFAWSAGRRWAWVRTAAGRPDSWLNITTGFDDSTAWLRRELPSASSRSIDLFDGTVEHDAPLRRARGRYPPAAPSMTADRLGATVPAGSQDVVFLLMSAHETHGADRRALFAAARHSLAPSGRMILVEHLRDLPNLLAFGPGAWHFQTRATWLAIAANAGLGVVTEVRLSPFVRGFAFEIAR